MDCPRSKLMEVVRYAMTPQSYQQPPFDDHSENRNHDESDHPKHAEIIFDRQRSLGAILAASAAGDAQRIQRLPRTPLQPNPQPSPLLHPSCLQARFGATSNGVYMAATVQNGEISCAGVLDSWSLNVTQIPRTSLKCRLQGRRVFAKGLLWNGSSDSVTSWLNEITPHLRNHSWAGLMIEAVAIDTPLWSAIDSTLKNRTSGLNLHRPQPLQPRWRIQLPGSIDEYWSRVLSSKAKPEIRCGEKERSSATTALRSSLSHQESMDF
jgi:hypothetical protein